MKSQILLLCALLAAPICAFAAPVASAHNPDDGHDHAAPAAPNESLADYFWRKSDDAFHAGDYPRAVSLHRAIVQVDPTDVESYSVGAWLLWSLQKGDEADAFIAQGLKANPENAEMWNAAGDQYSLEKKGLPTRDAYAKAVELSGDHPGQMLRRRLAHAQENIGALPASAEIWRALVKEFPNDDVNKNNLARVQAKLTDF